MAYIEISPKAQDSHRRLQDWRRANEDGFVLNYRGPNGATLHRTLCSTHLGDTEWEAGRENWGSLGNSLKVVSRSRKDLEEWGRGRGAGRDRRSSGYRSCRSWPK